MAIRAELSADLEAAGNGLLRITGLTGVLVRYRSLRRNQGTTPFLGATDAGRLPRHGTKPGRP